MQKLCRWYVALVYDNARFALRQRQRLADDLLAAGIPGWLCPCFCAYSVACKVCPRPGKHVAVITTAVAIFQLSSVAVTEDQWRKATGEGAAVCRLTCLASVWQLRRSDILGPDDGNGRLELYGALPLAAERHPDQRFPLRVPAFASSALARWRSPRTFSTAPLAAAATAIVSSDFRPLACNYANVFALSSTFRLVGVSALLEKTLLFFTIEHRCSNLARPTCIHPAGNRSTMRLRIWLAVTVS